jgi:hypothetical protein
MLNIKRHSLQCGEIKLPPKKVSNGLQMHLQLNGLGQSIKCSGTGLAHLLVAGAEFNHVCIHKLTFFFSCVLAKELWSTHRAWELGTRIGTSHLA